MVANTKVNGKKTSRMATVFLPLKTALATKVLLKMIGWSTALFKVYLPSRLNSQLMRPELMRKKLVKSQGLLNPPNPRTNLLQVQALTEVPSSQ